MDPSSARDSIRLDSRTFSHHLILRKVAELVGDAPRLHLTRREWLVELTRAKLPAAWNALLGALRAEAGEAPWELVLVEDRHEEVNGVAVREGAGGRDVVRLQVAPKSVCAWCYGDAERSKQVEARLERALETVARVGQPDQVAVRFWHQSAGEAVDQMRRVQCPRFDEVAANYPSCQDALAWLMKLETPWEQGRLIFWHGPPGTGKTWALRALLREWSHVAAEVISDPDPFFASNAYLQQVLLAEPPTLTWNGGRAVRAEEKPRLFVLEDAPQLLLQESRATQGTRIANLLSMTDGILGQGLRAVFLITTNEKVQRVDPAIRRPGRCLQELELPNFTREQADEWLAAKGASPPTGEPGSEPSLAELYERLHRGSGRPRAREERMGFLRKEPKER